MVDANRTCVLSFTPLPREHPWSPCRYWVADRTSLLDPSLGSGHRKKYNTIMPSDTEDDHSRSSSPEESGGEQDGVDMAVHRHDRDGNAQNGHKSSSNVKDPLRPRRKKARRACFACQRAHLTCGK